MAWPASGPGRLLERYGDVAPRGMTVHDKTRLIGRLRRFHRLAGDESPKVLRCKTLGPGPRASALQFPAPVGAPPLLKGAVALRIFCLARCASWWGKCGCSFCGCGCGCGSCSCSCSAFGSSSGPDCGCGSCSWLWLWLLLLPWLWLWPLLLPCCFLSLLPLAGEGARRADGGVFDLAFAVGQSLSLIHI